VKLAATMRLGLSPSEEKMKIIPLLVLLCAFSGIGLARAEQPIAKDKTKAWWGHSHSHVHRNREKARHHTGRRPISTHHERRRQHPN
jgi:hypothetical protein